MFPVAVASPEKRVEILPVAVERFELVVLSPVVRVAMLPVAVARLDWRIVIWDV